MRRTWLVLLTIGLIASLALLGACSSDDDDPSGSTELSYLAGDWTGEWNNDTSGSSAPMSLSITVSDDGTASLTIDLLSSDLGAPFGVDAPGAITLDGTHDAAGLHVDVRDHELFGDMVVLINPAGTLQADATMDGVPEIIAMSVQGTFTRDGMDATYTIVFPDTTTARGTATFTRE